MTIVSERHRVLSGDGIRRLYIWASGFRLVDVECEAQSFLPARGLTRFVGSILPRSWAMRDSDDCCVESVSLTGPRLSAEAETHWLLVRWWSDLLHERSLAV